MFPSFQEVQLWLVPIWVLQNSLFIFMNILWWNVMETKLSCKQRNVFHYCQEICSLEGMKSKNCNIRVLCGQREWNMNLLYVFAPFMCTTLLFFFWSINAKKKRLCEIKTTFVSFVLVLFLSMSIVFSKCGCCPKCLCCVVKITQWKRDWKHSTIGRKRLLCLLLEGFSDWIPINLENQQSFMHTTYQM
jgi:hypothetical protein